MDDIRISDAGINSSSRGLNAFQENVQDSIDMIDDELRRLLETRQPSDRSSKRESRHSHGDVEDRFSNMIAQIEMALSGDNQIADQLIDHSQKKQESANSNQSQNAEIERRKTVVKGFQVKETVHLEENQSSFKKATPSQSKPVNKWAVLEGKRATIQHPKRPLKPLVEITNFQNIPDRVNHSSLEVESHEKPHYISCSANSTIKTDSKQQAKLKQVDKAKKSPDAIIKKPRLIPEESFVSDETKQIRDQCKSRQPLTRNGESAQQPENSKKPQKPVESIATFSPIQKRHDPSAMKSAAEDILQVSEGSAGKHMSNQQREELQKLVLAMKMAELKSKFDYLLGSHRPTDGLIFIKLVADIVKDSLTSMQGLNDSSEGKALIEVLLKLIEKVRELGKTMAVLKLTEDIRLSSAIVDNLTSDIQAVMKVINQSTSYQSSLKKSHKAIDEKERRKNSTAKSEKEKKEEDLELCVKKSLHKVSMSREKLSAKLDFSDAANSNAKNQKNEQRFPSAKENIQGQGRPYTTKPRDYIQTDAGREDRKEADMISSQRFGCRVHCMKLMAKKLLCGFEDGTLSVFSVSKLDGLTLQKSGKLHPRGISSIACTTTEQRKGLIFTGYSGTLSCSIVVWDASTVKPLKELCGHTGTISSLQYIVPNYLVSTSFDRKVIFWDLDECEAALSSEVHQTPILSSHYDPDSKCLFTGSLDGCIVISGLVMEEGELIDLKIFKKIAGNGPILQLASCLDDKLLSLQNSRLIIYDCRGLQCKEIKTNTIPTSIQMFDDEKGVFVDAEGRPQAVDLVKPKDTKREYGAYSSSTVDKNSLLLASRLNGANCESQVFYEGAQPIVITANEKLDMIALYRIK